MSGEQFNIRRTTPQDVVYDEGPGHSVDFKCRPGVHPPRIWVPAQKYWANRMPTWAHSRRDVIISRLRAGGAILYEQDDTITTIRSPDGSFRVECITEPDERAAPWETTNVVTTADNQAIVHLPLFSVEGLIEFPHPGQVVLPLKSRYGPRHVLRVNVPHSNFRLDGDQADQPLHTLVSRMGYDTPRQQNRYVRPKTTSRRQVLGDVAIVLFGMIMVPGGIWMAFSATKLEDRLAGAAGVVLFGAGAVVSYRNLRRR